MNHHLHHAISQPEHQYIFPVLVKSDASGNGFIHFHREYRNELGPIEYVQEDHLIFCPSCDLKWSPSWLVFCQGCYLPPFTHPLHIHFQKFTRLSLVVCVETEYCEMLFRLETECSNKELYQIIAQSRPVQMISY